VHGALSVYGALCVHGALCMEHCVWSTMCRAHMEHCLWTAHPTTYMHPLKQPIACVCNPLQASNLTCVCIRPNIQLRVCIPTNSQSPALCLVGLPCPTATTPTGGPCRCSCRSSQTPSPASCAGACTTPRCCKCMPPCWPSAPLSPAGYAPPLHACLPFHPPQPHDTAPFPQVATPSTRQCI